MKELMKTLKAMVNKRREISMIDIGSYDSDYNNAMERVIELEKKKGGLKLSLEARETIDQLLEAFDAAEVEQVNLAYLAGMADCLIVLDRLELFQL